MRIIIVDVSGLPIPEASVTIVASTVTVPEIALLADASGVVRLTLPKGRFTFQAYGPGGVQGMISVETDGTRESTAEIVMTEEAARQ
ncbi:MAG: hypothetical protein EOM91_14915 [Sphingobacteriia bacterium]|nr:hypothetical protein [Sphingobacteriia bacterium]NCC41017.1 hypothetical protein [Gammaproteobacteria bacterium]